MIIERLAHPEAVVENPGDILEKEFPLWAMIRDFTTRQFMQRKGYQPKQLPHVLFYILATARSGKSQFPVTYLKRFIENNYSGGSERDLPLLKKILNEAFSVILKLEQGEYAPLRRQGDDWVLSNELRNELRATLHPQQPGHFSGEEPHRRLVDGIAERLNPYYNRKMIKHPSQFHGRCDELSRIFSRIQGARPQCLSIVGERRIGKSSLLWHIQNREVYSRYLSPHEGYVFVFLDLQEHVTMTIGDFFELFFHRIAESNGESGCGENRDYSGFKALAESFEKTGIRLLVLLDEFDKVTMNSGFGPEFFSFLRSMANRYELAFITSSTKALQQLCSTEEIEASPFFNIFTPLYLSVFKPDEAHCFIREPSKTAGFSLEPWTEQILDLGGYHPFFLQIACSAAFDAGQQDCAVHWHHIRAQFLEESGDHFVHFFKHMEPREREVVSLIARGGDLLRKHHYILEDMKKRGIAYELRGQRVFFSPLFADYILQQEESEGLWSG